MVTDYKQVMRDRTTGSEIFGAWMQDVTCQTVARFRNPWPNKVPKDRRGAGVKQKNLKNLSKMNSSKEIRTTLRLTGHGSSVLNLSKFDESRIVGFDWSSREPPHENTRRKITHQAASKKQELGLARWRSSVGLPEVLFWQFSRTHEKETQKSTDPTKVKCCKLVQQRDRTQSSTFQALSFSRIFQQKRPMKNDAPAN